MVASVLADFRAQGLYFLGGTADTGGMETNASPVLPLVVPVCMIRTRFLGPTDHQPARVVASMLADSKLRVVVSWNYTACGSDGHVPAVLALIAKANEKRAELSWPIIRMDHLQRCGDKLGDGFVWSVQEVRS